MKIIKKMLIPSSQQQKIEFYIISDSKRSFRNKLEQYSFNKEESTPFHEIFETI